MHNAQIEQLEKQIAELKAAVYEMQNRPADSPGRDDFWIAQVVEGEDNADEEGDLPIKRWAVNFVDATFETDYTGDGYADVTVRSETTYIAAGDQCLHLEVGDLVVVRLKYNRYWIVEKYADDRTLTSSGTCPDGTVPVTYITDVQCVSNQIVTCTRTKCEPPCSLVTAEDCGEGATEGGAEIACCGGIELSETLTLTLTFAGATDCDECGGGTSFTQDVTITWNGSTWTGAGQIGTCSEDAITVEYFYCVGGNQFALRFSLGDKTVTSTGSGGTTCDPFSYGETLGGGTSIGGTSCTALVLTEFEVAE